MANIIKVDRTRKDDSDIEEAGAASASMQLSSEDERQRKAAGEAPMLDISSEDDENRDEEKTDNISNRESESMSSHPERIPFANSGTLIQLPSEGNMKRDDKEQNTRQSDSNRMNTTRIPELKLPLSHHRLLQKDVNLDLRVKILARPSTVMEHWRAVTGRGLPLQVVKKNSTASSE